ncbi:BET1-like protein isoform X1 [Pelecanus crispus]|uniref:BET1-like protein isoform X1 n=1 Tax=Pelecanus crispus TaxID=36300 RepID=UPI003F5D2EA3
MAEWGRGQSANAVEDMLDAENKRMADSLANKVTRLKSLALDIDKDADEQNRYLDGMRACCLRAQFQRYPEKQRIFTELKYGDLSRAALARKEQVIHCSAASACAISEDGLYLQCSLNKRYFRSRAAVFSIFPCWSRY